MALRNEDTAAEIVGGVRAARAAAHEVVGEQLERGKQRLRSTSKTRKSIQTRKRIMNAACALMIERGSTNFQLGEVSERCHMSKGSLYYYFGDKDELVDAIFDEQVDALVCSMEEVAAQATTAREALGSLYSEFVKRMQEGGTLALALTYELGVTGTSVLPGATTHFTRATKVLSAQIERAKIEGLVREDVDSAGTAIYMMGGLIMMSLAYASRRIEDSVEEITENLLSLILHGMA